MIDVKIERVSIYFDQLQAAFDKAGRDHATKYNSQTCRLTDAENWCDCPICYFQQRVKVHLGIYTDNEAK